MKTILIICGTFPPQSDVGGLRPAMFCKYLPEFGWEPFVLTRDYTPEDPRFDTQLDIGSVVDNGHIFRIPFSRKNEEAYISGRRPKGILRDLLMPEYSCPAGLLERMEAAAEGILHDRRFDVILSTFPDQWELTLGAFLSRKYGIPLVADFRDIPEQEAGIDQTLRQKFQGLRFLARRNLALRNTALITVVSKCHREILEEKIGRKTVLVYNGFDDELFHPQKLPLEAGQGPFRITYTGRIINLWYQNPAVLLSAIDELISTRKISCDDVLLDFYGVDVSVLAPLLGKLENTAFCRFNSRESYSSVPSILARSQMLLVLTNRGRKGILTTKFFEYMGMTKPILCVPGDGGEMDELIKEFQLGFSIGEIEELKARLVEWVNLWKTGQFPEFVESDVGVFTRKYQSRILADEMNHLLQNG
jgi:glycosyltransferase involved in cell wall biosynthesis